MSNKIKPIVAIVLAVALAAGIAFYMSRQTSASNDTPGKTTVGGNPGGGHVRGNASAPVTLVEFGDYQCPSCGYYYPMVEELLRRYPDKVKLEFHQYPLVSVHPHALAAAMAAEAAGEQGKYWEMHDMIYSHQEAWSRLPDPESQFRNYAATIGLDANKFMSSVKSQDIQRRIVEDIQRGSAAKVTGTPSFFINGSAVNPLPMSVDEFGAMIDAALQSTPPASK